MNSPLTLWLGRGLLALAFMGPGGAHLLERWRERQMSASAGVALLELGAGLAILVGWQVRWVGLALAVFLLADAFVSHAFWHVVPSDQRNQLLHFFKNAALAGAFLLQGSLSSATSQAWPMAVSPRSSE